MQFMNEHWQCGQQTSQHRKYLVTIQSIEIKGNNEIPHFASLHSE